MPATISVNFASNPEAIAGSLTNKSIHPAGLKAALDSGGGGSGYVTVAGTQTIAGTKTFSALIGGSISGNAATATNATTVTNGVYTTGNQTIAGIKTFSSLIGGSISGNAATATNATTVTNGVYTTGNQTIANRLTIYSNVQSNDVFNGGIELREVGAVANATSDTSYAPALSYHWSNIAAAKIAMYSDGQFHFVAQGGNPSAYTNIYVATLFCSGVSTGGSGFFGGLSCSSLNNSGVAEMGGRCYVKNGANNDNWGGAAAGSIAIKNGSDNPFMSFHRVDGGRNGYIQMAVDVVIRNERTGNNTGSIEIKDNGRIGINTNAGAGGPDYAFTVDGRANKKNNSTAWDTVSDGRIKENIQLADINQCYNNVKNLPLKRFTYKTDIFATDVVTDRSQLGWIAQDVQSVFPKSVEGIDRTFNTTGLSADDVFIKDCLIINQEQVYASLYGAVQKLINVTETQAQTITTLQTELAQIKQQIGT